MNSTRSATVPTRPPSQYDETLFQMMGKGYNETPTRSTIPTSSTTTQITSSNNSDQYTQIRQSNSSAVFDPNDFPSLGGAITAPNNVSINSSSLINNVSTIASSALGNTQTPNNSMNGLGQFSEHYSVSAFRDNRTKAVDALTGSSVASEFNMQNEDFPALGGTPVASNIRSSSILPGTLHSSPFSNNNNAPNGNTTTEKMNGSDIFYESNSSAPQSQPQTVLGRAKTRPDQSYPTRTSFIGNGFQVTDPRSTQQSIDRTNALSFPYGQRQKQLDLSSSPSKVIPQNMNSVLGNRTRPPFSADLLSTESSQPDNFRTSIDPDQNITNPLANGNSIGPEAYSNGTLHKYSPELQEDLHALTVAKTPESRLQLPGLLPVVSPLLFGKAGDILTVGLDLTALGLNLTSPEPLHKTFENPWDQSNPSVRSHEPEYKLPSCYYMQPPALGMSHFTKFQLETLFYIFYNMPKDVLQILAAEELYNKKWMYHKDLKLWFTCNPETMQGYERTGYIYFDLKSWEKRPFKEANQSFIQGLMKEEELKGFKVTSL